MSSIESILKKSFQKLVSSTRIMVSKGTWHKTSTQNLRVFWRFWVLITLTSTLNPICPVLRYPCGKQFFSTEYPSNEIYFPDKKPYSGDIQYKKGHFGRKWPKMTKIVKRRGGFIIASTVFLLNGPFLYTSYPYNFKKVSTDFEKYP